jgi:hypothetical protein
MLASHFCGVFKKLLFLSRDLCILAIALALVLAVFLGHFFILSLPFALFAMTSISFEMITEFFVRLARNLTSLAINHYPWLIILVLAIFVTIPDLQRATLEELKEEVEKRETMRGAHDLSKEEFLKTVR